MAKFITTVELQSADDKDYDILNTELQKELFILEKHDAKSHAYITDRISYSKEGNFSLLQVTDSIKRAASKIGKNFSFRVMKNKSITNLN